MLNGLGLALLALSAPPASAERLDDKISFQASAFFPSIDSEVRIDSNTGTIATDVDFERDLGAASHKTLPAFKAEWRSDDDWVLNAEVYKVGRRQCRAIDPTIVVGDPTYPVQATRNSGFDSDVYRFTIGNYSGRLINAAITAASRVHKNIDIGVMFRRVDYRLQLMRDKFEGQVQYRFSGPAVFVQLGF